MYDLRAMIKAFRRAILCRHSTDPENNYHSRSENILSFLWQKKLTSLEFMSLTKFSTLTSILHGALELNGSQKVIFQNGS